MPVEPVPYLANIILVAQSSGSMSAVELGQLEEIRVDHKFKKGDFNTALRLVEQNAHKLTPVGTFSDRVRNLELMLRVAYADDDLDSRESFIIDDFAKSIGLHDEQVTCIHREVLESLKCCPQMCPQCGASANTEAKFCPACGFNFSSTDGSAACQYSVPAKGITIEFAESTAGSFSKALEHARNLETFRIFQKNKKNWYSVVYPSGNVEEALPLIQCLSGLRNRYVHIDGIEQIWDDVFGFAWCSTQRATAYRPVEYCFGKDDNRLNPWSCKQSRMDWTEWANWFCYGRWEKSGIFGGKLKWRFDKDRIRHELQTNLFRYRFCPYLCTDISEAVIKHLPDVVTPDTDPSWGYHRSYEATPGAVKITEKDRSSGFTFTNEYWADGVSPKGLKAFEEIMSNVLRQHGNTQINMLELLK